MRGLSTGCVDEDNHGDKRTKRTRKGVEIAIKMARGAGEMRQTGKSFGLVFLVFIQLFLSYVSELTFINDSC